MLDFLYICLIVVLISLALSVLLASSFLFVDWIFEDNKKSVQQEIKNIVKIWEESERDLKAADAVYYKRIFDKNDPDAI